MKDCKDCEYCKGYDYSDGTPICEHDGGYEGCPFNDYAPTMENGVKIEIDSDFLTDYIRHTIENTAHGCAVRIAESEVKKIIDDELKANVKETVQAELEKIVKEQVAEFMAGDITVGGGWSEPTRTVSREQFMSETIQKELDKLFKQDTVKTECSRVAQAHVESFTRGLRYDIDKGLKQCFDAATRQVLTDNVVSMLMQNDTYQKLSNSMGNLLGSK